MRFTMERAVVGERRSTNHLAKFIRDGSTPSGNECKNDGTPGSTTSIGLKKSPRDNSEVSRRLSLSLSTN